MRRCEESRLILNQAVQVPGDVLTNLNTVPMVVISIKRKCKCIITAANATLEQITGTRDSFRGVFRVSINTG